MKTELENFIEVIHEDLAWELQTYTDTKLDNVIQLILGAYNRYEESERDGVDYLFYINNTDDVKCCIEGGMTTKEIAQMYDDFKENRNTGYFFFGQNYDKAKPIIVRGELIDLLIGTLHDVLLRVVCYPYSSEAYKALYGYCVTDYMINNGMI